MAKVDNLDFYAILDINIDANEKEIVTAYRKKALKCHPDKNPDNPRAAEEFHLLTKALEVLTDAAARAAFDRALRAKKAAELRNKELDSKRRKLKDDLEAREKAAKEQNDDIAKYSRTLQQEIERLRREGSQLVEEEQRKLAEELKRKQEVKEETPDTEAPRLRVKWKAKKGDPNNGGYSQELLHKAFSKYGEVTAIIVSSKKCGSAVVEFESPDSAMMAFETETGLPDNPLTLSWLSGRPDEGVSESSSFHQKYFDGDISRKRTSEQASLNVSEISSSHDYESLVLHRMRQAEERRRLAEQMQKEDES